MTKRVVIYSRVSTDAQERDGTSLDTQERACVEYATERGLTLVESVRDTASGFSLERPGLDQVRRLASTGQVDVVLAYALDRLSRKQTHVAILVEEMEQISVALEFVTEEFEKTAVGQLIRSVKAFAAEFEREKIAERTMRGKAERARSGRLPQGTGVGCYGYLYSPATGQRTVDPMQAATVRRIFEGYERTRSLSAISAELNEAGVPAFEGGRWYPPTIRRVLMNPTYVGRTAYRRTKLTRVGGKRVVTPRPVSEWITIPNASPSIIDEPLWDRVQAILDDPERTRRRPEARFYALSSRLRCRTCLGAMVGQTLTTGGKPYKYYRCRHAYDHNTSRQCSARYVRADALEAGVWEQVTRVLASPQVILKELSRLDDAVDDQGHREVLEAELAQLGERERRVVRLFGLGGVDEAVIHPELAEIGRRKTLVSREIAATRPRLPAPMALNDAAGLEDICARIGALLVNADDNLRSLALTALQVQVVTDKDGGTVSGILPLDPCSLPDGFGLISDEQSCRCSFNGE